MMEQLFTPLNVWKIFAGSLGRLAAPGTGQGQPEVEEACARRRFIREMIWNNPDAFSSDLDVQNMMQVYHHQF